MYSTLTPLQQIRSRFTEYDIFKFYIPNLSIGTNISSPLRDDDKNPSFRVYWNKSGKLNFCDYKLGITGNAFQYVMTLYGLSFQQAVEKILADLDGTPTNHQPVQYATYTEKTKIGYRVRSATDIDRNFWTQYFRISTVKKLKIYPISRLFTNGYSTKVENTYVFLVGSRVKVYQPYSVPKYFGNTNKNSIQGWHLLDPTKRDLKLVSSLKEIGVLYEQGIQAIAPNSESSIMDSHVMRFLKTYWDLEILYDWDEAGRTQAKRHSIIYDIPINPLQYENINIKDISDFRKAYGFYQTKELCEKLLC